VLYAVRFRADGSYTGNARRGAATPMTHLTATPSAGGVRIYTRVDGAMRSTRFDLTGRPGPWSVVTADRTSTVLAAEAAGRPVAVWTVQGGRGNAAFRVRIARP
jgi:hypothetical protein